MDTDTILTALQFIVPFFGGGGILVVLIAGIKKIIFYTKVAKQAVAAFEELKEENLKIYYHIQKDPKKKELAKVLLGGVRKIEGLTGLEIIPRGKKYGVPNIRSYPPAPPVKPPKKP